MQTWTLNSTCTTYMECDGTLKSDEGWSTRLYMLDGTMWYARHEVPNWERCQDGTAFTGKQTFSFYPVNPDGSGEIQLGSPVMAGKNKTIGPSGACGQNQWLTIDTADAARQDRLTGRSIDQPSFMSEAGLATSWAPSRLPDPTAGTTSRPE